MYALSKQEEGSYTRVKIADFGFAKKVHHPNSLTTVCGTEGFVAPEVIETHPEYDVQCDMWSLGVVIYILLGGYRPFRGEGDECLEKIRYGEYKFHQKYWSDVSDEAKILISRMLTVDPTRRITAEEALRSSWIMSGEEYDVEEEEEEDDEEEEDERPAYKKSSNDKNKAKARNDQYGKRETAKKENKESAKKDDRVPEDMRKSGKVSAARDMFENKSGGQFKFY